MRTHQLRTVCGWMLGAAGFSALAACSSPPPPSALELAYAAAGGDMLKTISFKAHWAQWDPGESYSVSDPLKPDTGMSDVVEARDLEKGLTRADWMRPKADDGTIRTFTEIVTPTAGLVIGNDATAGRLPKRSNTTVTPPQHTMSGPRLTASLREFMRTDIVREMHKHPDKVTNLTPPGGGAQAIPTYRYTTDQGVFTVMLDQTTKLPDHVTTQDWDALFGDAIYDAAFSDWRDVMGVKVPGRIDYTLGGMKVAEVTLSDFAINPMLDAASFAIPEDMAAMAAKPASIDQTPFQWIIRRQFTGFYLDSGAYYTDEGDSLKLVDVAPNVAQVVGGTHNSLIIATNSYLVMVDAPNDDGQSKWTIDAAAMKYPGKPIKYLVLTHHHVDHVGGFRQFAAAGATLVVGPGDGDFYRKWLMASQTANPNPPQNPVKADVIEVMGKWSVNDGGRVVEAYAIPSPHSDDTLIAYLPRERLGFVTDIWIPGAPLTNPGPDLIAFLDAVNKTGIKPLKFAGGHGGVGNFADVVAAVQKARAAKPAAAK